MKKYSKKELLAILAKHLGAGAAILALILLFSKLFGSFCPTYRIFGICCPFCGMTRAHLAALRLDLSAALYYHPVFFLGLPCIFFAVHEDLFAPKYNKLRKIIAYSLFAVIVVVYIVRVCLYGFDFFD